MELLTNKELTDLRKQHAPLVVPPCHLCGGTMVRVFLDLGLIGYACLVGDEKHYSASYIDFDNVDERVLKLLDQYEAAQLKNTKLLTICLRLVKVIESVNGYDFDISEDADEILATAKELLGDKPCI